MPWHLHLSRTAFMVGAWPFIEMAVLWTLFRARARPSLWGFAAVGALVGLGVYTYNAYPLFVPVVAVPFLYDLAAARERAARRRWLVHSAAAALTAVWAAALMVDYAARHEEYFWHHGDVSVLRSDAWGDASWPQRGGILAARGAEWAKGLLFGGRPDDGDGLGERGHPLLDPLTSTAALVGLGMAARGWRRPEYGVLLAAVLVLPFGALLTIDDGLYRRTFGLAPFVALLAALPLAWLWRRARGWSGAPRVALAGVIALAVGAAAARNVHAYFGPLQRSEAIRYVYPYQMDAAARAVAGLPRDTIVYLYSDRWAARFETIKWLAPGMEVVDRSREYRKDVEPAGPLDFAADPRGRRRSCSSGSIAARLTTCVRATRARGSTKKSGTGRCSTGSYSSQPGARAGGSPAARRAPERVAVRADNRALPRHRPPPDLPRSQKCSRGRRLSTSRHALARSSNHGARRRAFFVVGEHCCVLHTTDAESPPPVHRYRAVHPCDGPLAARPPLTPG